MFLFPYQVAPRRLQHILGIKWIFIVWGTQDARDHSQPRDDSENGILNCLHNEIKNS